MARTNLAALDSASLYLYSASNTYRGTFRTNSAGEIVLDSPGAFRFTVADSEKVCILSNGKVGVGTNNPAVYLELFGTVSEKLRLRNDNTDDSSITYYNSTTLKGYLQHAGNEFYISNQTAGGTHFDTNALERVTIDSGGLVGIGQIIPTSLLDITKNAIGVSQADANGISLINTTAAANGAPQYSPPLRFRGSAWDGAATAAHDYRFYVVPSNGTNKSHLDLDINDTGGYITYFRVWHNGERNIKGKVSIVGTTDTIATASSLLDVSKASIGVTQSDANGIKVENPTAATATTNQYSPPIVWEGSFWNPTGLNSVTTDFRAYVKTTSGTNPLGSGDGSWVMESQQGGDGYKEYLRVNPISGGLGITTPTSQTRYTVGGTLYSSSSSAQATNGAVADLITYTLPANTIYNTSDRVEISACGSFDLGYAGGTRLILEACNTKLIDIQNIPSMNNVWQIKASLFVLAGLPTLIYDILTITGDTTPVMVAMNVGISLSGNANVNNNIILRGQSGITARNMTIRYYPTQF